MSKKKEKICAEILKYLLIGGMIAIAATSPYAGPALIKEISRIFKKYQKRKIISAFDYLKRRGLIELKRENHDIKIFLTPKGKKIAQKYHLHDMKIKRPKKWDKKWRLVIFDIPHHLKVKRNAFRKKLKDLKFYPLQKSVWIHPFECKKELELLRKFFGFSKKNVQLLLVEKIEDKEILRKLQKFYKL